MYSQITIFHPLPNQQNTNICKYIDSECDKLKDEVFLYNLRKIFFDLTGKGIQTDLNFLEMHCSHKTATQTTYDNLLKHDAMLWIKLSTSHKITSSALNMYSVKIKKCT